MLAKSAATLALILCQAACTQSGSFQQQWIQGWDDTSDYEQTRSIKAKSSIHCTGQVSRDSSVQLVTFNTSTAECNTFRCRLGLSHCRKCRNVHHGNQMVWTRNTSCWTTVQHRVSGSVDFYRNWFDYKAGFGDGPGGNFWIGLDTLHSLTAEPGRELRFLMRLWNGSESWAQYSSFSVGPESDMYRLSVSGFSGSDQVGNALASSNNMKFTTMDNDHDTHGGNCATFFYGAWWFSACHGTHPNGVYQELPIALNCSYAQGLIWKYPFGYYYSLMEIEMLVL